MRNNRTSQWWKPLIRAVWAYYGQTGIKAKYQSVETDFIEFSSLDPLFDFYSPLLIVNRIYMDENKDLVRAFVRATKKGYEYAIENLRKQLKFYIQIV